MFRPIKNFINYIQKNASGSAIFGNTTTIGDTETEADAEEVGIEATKINNNNNNATKEAEAIEERSKTARESDYSYNINEQRENKKMKRMQINKVKIVNDKSGATIAVVNGREPPNGTAINVESDEDDIEMQITSSVMLRQPIKPRVTVVENLTDELDGDGDADGVGPPTHSSLLDRSDVDSQEDDNEEYPNISLLSDDGTTGAGEDTAEEEVITEGEDTAETFLDLTNDQDHRFADSEIIVIGDDVNSSMASDAPSEDPLAIDDSTQPSITSIKDTLIPLDSSTNDEASTSTDLWSNIDHLKKNTTTPNVEKDLTETSAPSTPQRPLTTETTNSRGTSSNVAPMLSTERDEHAEELRSDGSDSGLGSETSALQITMTSVTDTSQLATPSDTSASNTPTANKSKLQSANNDYSSGNSSGTSTATLTDSVVVATSSAVALSTVAIPPPLKTLSKPLRSNLKRRLDDVDALGDDAAQQTQLTNTDGTLLKKLKRSINFDNVQVFYFPRQQGFGCVPSAGGCTLGMGSRHIGFKTLTLAEHAAELRRAHRLQLQEINPRGSSSDDSEESEEDYLSEGSGSDLDAESNGFLQPVSPKQRRALLKAAGVRKIDTAEKVECRNIRNSREVCGCSCVEFCDPETCACSQAGIKCQVDRAMFPCGCTRDACGNIAGRVEFNPTRVRTHFIHTIMRLEMENRQQQNPPLCNTMSSYNLSAACATSSSLVGGGPHVSGISTTPSYANSLPGSYYTMQTQSNYSSGYASPAYTTEPAANYYQQQNSSSTTTTSTTHFSAVATTTDLQTSTQQNYQLDTLDAGLYTGAATATPVYGEMLPSYSSTMGVSASTATVSAYHQNVNYSAVQQTQVSSYGAYQQATSSGYLSQQTASVAAVATAAVPPTTFSSCAVPSLPPYGTATTTAAAAQYEDSSSYALVDTTAPSCISMEDSGGSDVPSDVEEAIIDGSCVSAKVNDSSGKIIADSNIPNTLKRRTDSGGSGNSSCQGFSSGSDTNANDNESDSSFIQLSAPVSSATRLSQINDLLQHNRHTTATLVAVSHTTTKSLSENNNSTQDKPICVRSITTDCDYNNDSNSNNSLLDDVKENKNLEKAKEVIASEIVTIEEKQVAPKEERIDKTSKTTLKQQTAETKNEPLRAVNTASKADCATAKQKEKSVAVTTDVTLNDTASDNLTASIGKTDNGVDSKDNAILVGTNTTTATATSIRATSTLNVDSN